MSAPAPWRYTPELLARAVPRYTSYPTAAEFTPAIGAAALETALAQVSGDVSLYLHIPYCQQICWYCGCNTGAANRRERLTAYLDALHQEIALVGARLAGRARVTRIAFGGGSPNAILPSEFAGLADALTRHFMLAAPVWSAELDPRSFTPGWEQALADVGVTRASLGVQTFAPELQAAIGREQPLAMIEDCTRALRRAGVTSLNYDLMYGLPGQTLAQLDDTLAQALALGPDRIALFGYAHVPHLLPRQRRIDASALPDTQTRFAMAARGHEALAAAGYVPIGFDHFALPHDALAKAAQAGRLHRNFQGFTEDQAGALIGLGASAISSFDDVLVQNEKNAGRYRMLLSQDCLPVAMGVARGPDDRETGATIMELLCHGAARVGRQRLAEMAPALQPFIDRGLVACEGETLRLLPGALPYARSIAALFDRYRETAGVRFSTAV